MFLLTAPDHGRDVVTRCCERAVEAGVYRGMTLAHARALLHDAIVHVEAERPERDAAAVHALARWAIRVAPTVALDGGDGLVLDVTGCERLYRGERRLLAMLRHRLEGMGVRCRIAIAPTLGAAWACARYGDALTLLDEGDLSLPLGPLPIEALRIESAVVEELASVGVRRVEQLLDLPRAQLADRFGEALLRRIDQAVGRVPEALEPIRPAPVPRVERVFDGPVKQVEAIELTVRELVDALAVGLRQRQAGVQRLRLRLQRSDLDPVTETLELSRPSRDAKHLWTLLRPRVERLHLGYGVDAVELEATQCGFLLPEQSRLAGDGEDAPIDTADAGRLIDLLVSRLGAEHVLCTDGVDTHVPEKAFRWRPAREGATITSAPAPSPPRGDRPSRLLPHVHPIDVTIMNPEGPIVLLRRDEPLRVLTTIGPERITPRWWRSRPGEPPPVRDYYKLQVEDGRWFWVFRESGSGRWFLHGVWG